MSSKIGWPFMDFAARQEGVNFVASQSAHGPVAPSQPLV
jgi:hypothetical protein